MNQIAKTELGRGFCIFSVRKGTGNRKVPSMSTAQCALSFGSAPEPSLQASLQPGTGAQVPATEANPRNTVKPEGEKEEGGREREQKKGEGKEEGREERRERKRERNSLR